MRTGIKKYLLILLLAGTILAEEPIQSPQLMPDITIDAATRIEVIEGIVKALNDTYVYSEVATKMEQALRKHQQQKEYDSITSGRQFARTLTTHLQEVSHDKHIAIGVYGRRLPPELAEGLAQQQNAMLARTNFGFERVERLAGNIGYLELKTFAPVSLMGDTAATAMNFLSNADALIIDLRQNNGGESAAVALITSYLFGPQPIHLNDIYWRPTNETHQWWTLPYVPGKRLTDKDVYLLTSHNTFSAAEEFAYNLKNLKRAVIVGEATGGGAHPISERHINDHFSVFVPAGRAINPITKTNWEGTGVEPDVKVSAEQALKTAHLMSLEKLESKLKPTDHPMFKSEVTNAIQKLKKELAETQEKH